MVMCAAQLLAPAYSLEVLREDVLQEGLHTPANINWLYVFSLLHVACCSICVLAAVCSRLHGKPGMMQSTYYQDGTVYHLFCLALSDPLRMMLLQRIRLKWSCNSCPRIPVIDQLHRCKQGNLVNTAIHVLQALGPNRTNRVATQYGSAASPPSLVAIGITL
jgi:hypothetical protein